MKELLALVGGFLLVIVLPIFLLLCIHFETREQNVSGVAYNVSNESLIGGNTHFSIRASEDTVVTEENQSKYCVPGDSPYKGLINRATEDKDIKLIVKTEKFFTFAWPWTCVDNVTVTEVKAKKE